jgi:isopenicillin N synthase-like dioxygenase
MATLPILDLSLFLSNSPEDKAKFVSSLQDAVLKYGFFYLKNAPSLTPELQDQALKHAKAFFALPLEEKLKIEMIKSPHFRGYQRLGAETTNFKQDNREQIDYGMEVPAENMTENTPAYLGLKGPNQWPDVPGFKDTILEYMNTCCEIAKTLMRAVAISLDLDENHFATFEHEPHVRMKVVRYPPMGHETDKPHEHGLGVGPHKVSASYSGTTASDDVALTRHNQDYGCLTILLQDDVGGLQVQGMDGVWIVSFLNMSPTLKHYSLTWFFTLL